MTTISDNFIYNYDDAIPVRVENTFESFLENYFNNIIIPIEDDSYIDLESVLNNFDSAEEIITSVDSLTQFQRSIVDYLSVTETISTEPEELTTKQKCERDGLEYNEHKDKCCKSGQEYNPSSNRCRKKQRHRVTIDENITVIEQCERDGYAYNSYTKKCCPRKDQEYIPGKKRCTKKKRSPPPPSAPAGPSATIDVAGPSQPMPSPTGTPLNEVQQQCIKKGLSYNPVANKCCSNKSLEYVSGKRCSKKKKPRSPSGPVITSPTLDNNDIKQQCIEKGLAYNAYTKKCCSKKDQEHKPGNKRCTKKK